MSSPKRTAKAVAKTATKTATPRAALRPVTKPGSSAEGGLAADVRGLATALERSIVDDKIDAVPVEALQKLIAAACRVYTARREAGEDFSPVPKNSISATDVMVVASGLLQAADLAVFELGMWQNWTGR